MAVQNDFAIALGRRPIAALTGAVDPAALCSRLAAGFCRVCRVLRADFTVISTAAQTGVRSGAFGAKGARHLFSKR
jgi:hypothetical protein